MATISEQLTQLQTDKQTLVDNLVTKGVEATSNETFTSLVPKVLNIETGIVPSGTIEITENGTYDVSDKASANVNVGGLEITDASYLFCNNARSDTMSELIEILSPDTTKFNNMFASCSNLTIAPQLNTSNGTNFNSMFYYCSNLTTVPQFDTSNGTDFTSMFNNCKNLTTVPQFDTSNGTDFISMFSYCSNLTTVPQFDTSNGINFGSMFYYCKNLTTVPQFNTSNGTNFYSMFNNCQSLTIVPQLNTSNGNNFGGMFNNCKNLTTVPQFDTSNGTDFTSMFNKCSNLKNLGGFKDLGKAYLTTQSANNSAYQLVLSSSSSLTHDSLMNIINKLYNIASAGVKAQSLLLGATNLAKLTKEEIAIATNKGWTVR